MRNSSLSPLIGAAIASLLSSCGSSHLMSTSSPGAGSNPAKTPPTLTWAQPAAIAAGTALGPTQLDATANVAGTFAYSPAAGTVVAAGTQTLSVTFTPTDTADYTTAAASVKLVVNTKQNPRIVWAQPTPITTGAALGADQLNAQSDVAGTFAYSPAAGTVLEQGMQTLSVTFTPADAADYNAATATVPITVNAADNPGGLGGDCASGDATTGTFVYVSTGARRAGPYAVAGFSAAADGSLAPVNGSPFTTPGAAALNTIGTGSTVLGTDGYWLYSLAVHPDGCLNLESTAVAGQGPQNNPSVVPQSLYMDPSGTNLYSANLYAPDESYYASYSFNPGSGEVAQNGATQINVAADGQMLAFDQTGRFAVTSDCYFNEGPLVSEFKRNSDGTLTDFANGPLPQDASYCPVGAAADHANHFVIAAVECPQSQTCPGPEHLAVYTIDSAGKLTTPSSWQNTTTTIAVPGSFAGGYGFSPDDKYFAIGGYVGLDVFAWDSTTATLTHVAAIANPQGTCTGTNSSTPTCSGTPFGNLAWDSNDHLYTFLGNQLFVYNVTASGVTQAPGSPHAVQNPQWVTVVQPSGPSAP